MSARDRISRVVQQWQFSEPLFFSAWTAHTVQVNPRIRTIRVCHGRVEYDPEFIESLTRPQLSEVLQVEAMRIVLKHPYTRRLGSAELSYEASNLTLQEYLDTSLPLPRAHHVFGHDEFNRKYFEFYYHKLIDASSPLTPPKGTAKSAAAAGADGDDAGSGGREEGTSAAADGAAAAGSLAESSAKGLDAYADPDTVGGENATDWDADDLFADEINDHIRMAAETNSWGSVAGRFKERILATLKPKLNYRAVLRQFRASILSVERRLTRMKPNRRYGFLYMGSRYDFTTDLLFAVDVSGSMSNEDLRRGFSVVNQLFKYGIRSIDVVQFDTELKGPPVTWKKARHDTMALGRGGTDFRPIIEYLNENQRYDGAIIFTDGFAPTPPPLKNRRTRLLWLFDTESSYKCMANGLRTMGHAAFLKNS